MSTSVTLDRARAHVLGLVRTALPTVVVPVGLHLVGRVAAADVVADEAVPSLATSAMDGFALRSIDMSVGPTALRVVGTTLAGQAPAADLNPGEVVRIMTGGLLPFGADCVVPIELVASTADERIVVDVSMRAGQHVRQPGDDLLPGDVVLRTGTAVTAGHVAVLSALGARDVCVYGRPRVGVLSTGDELVNAHGPLRTGQIRDSNRPTLMALIAGEGAEPVDLGVVRDDASAISSAIRRGAATCDAVLTSGGVSMGDVDLVKQVLASIGETRWMQIAIKPAKPFAFGLVDGVPVFGLPGSPVAAAVSFELLVRPALRRLAGHPDPVLVRTPIRMVAPDGLRRSVDGKVHFVGVTVTVGVDGLEARSAGAQGSYQLVALAAANGLAVLADGIGIKPGERVEVLVFGQIR